MADVLVIDDDKMMCDVLTNIVDDMGHACICAHRISEGKKLLAANGFDIVLLDVNLPDGYGLDLLPEIQKLSSLPEVIIITSAGDPDGAELAIKNGAWDYIEKPFSSNDITLEISRALEHRTAKIQSTPLLIQREKIVGNSPLLQKSIKVLAKAASTDVSVLITGETGTGKELFSRAIHENSPRSNKNFVVVDCGAIPLNLLESQLFGSKKGAFTGADRDMEGMVKQADGGTLFMDEVGELSLEFQKVFLRILQERRFRPLGAVQEEQSDFRLVAATNRDLPGMVQAGRFREDLLFRLRAITIEIPPLRQRPEDTQDIVLKYTAEFCKRNNIGIKGFSSDFFDDLRGYHWPGNVRELIHALEWMITEHQGVVELTPKHLPEHIRIHIMRATIRHTSQDKDILRESRGPESFQSLKEARKEAVSDLEKQYMQDLLVAVQGDVLEACRISGLRRTQFYGLLKKHSMTLQK